MSFTVWERNDALLQPRHDEWAWVVVGPAGELYCYDARSPIMRELLAIYAPGTWAFAGVSEKGGE